MKSTMGAAWTVSVAASMALVASGSLLAADSADKACERCAPSNGWELDVTAGPGYVTGDNEFNFGNYTGLDDDGAYFMGDVFGRYWSESADYVRLEGYRLGRDSRAIFIEGGRQGLYEVRGFYQGIPVRQFDTTRTPYSGAGSDTLTLPPGWTRGAGTGGMTDLNGSLQDVTIKQDWDVYGAGISFTPTTRWAFDVDYRRQERNGKQVKAGSFFFNAAQLVSPTDYTTDEMDAAISYNAKAWQVRLAYYGSFFNNDHSSLTWDNAFASQAAGDDRGRLALAPDNESHQVSLGGSVLLPARTTLNGQISMGRMEQSEGLQGYTINPVVATGALPRDTAGARVETTNANLRVTSSPWRRFTVEGQFRYDERDNKTDENVYDYVVTDLFV
ncbi:MAG: MtrB/PioB family decaheme-associated outer membrane protein, partial [Chromatiales bacterium]